jgi:hypothetical protein
MEEKIESKITSLVEYIIGKPNEAVTLDDYTILAAELKDARFRREQGESNDRYAKLLATIVPGFGCAAPTTEPAVKSVAQTVKKAK